MKRVVPGLLLLVAGCADVPNALVDDLQRADVTGCSRVAVWAWLRGETEEVAVTTSIPVGDELEVPADDGGLRTWTRDLSSTRDGSVRVAFGEDLSQNGPCSHLPFPVTRSGSADTGNITLTLLEGSHGETGNTYATVALSLEGVEATLDDGSEVVLPDVTWTNVEVFLDAE